MDIGQLGDDAWTSLRTLVREELWLPAGAAVGVVAYLLWIGVTGAALTYLVEAIAGTLTVQPWTSLTTFVVVSLALLWVVGPAALATVLVADRVTNVRGNLRHGYRLRHPLWLLVPPAVLLAGGYAALAGTGEANWPILAVLVAGAAWFLVRTLAYSYRVFALSLPIVLIGVVFVTALVAAVAVLVLGALAVGREPLVADVLAGLAAETGIEGVATLHTETAQIAGVDLPLLVAAVVALPVGASLAYVAAQLLTSVVARVRKPVVRRPQLRTGQRYPEFARPTTSAQPDSRTSGPAGSIGGRAQGDRTGSDGRDVTGQPSSADDAGRTTPEPAGSATDAPETTAEDAATPTSAGEATIDDADEADEVDDVSHTRVYTPPDDADLDAIDPEPASGGDDGPAGRRCANCGVSVGASDSVCQSCGADLGGT